MDFKFPIFVQALTSRAFVYGAGVTLLVTTLAHSLAIVLSVPIALARGARWGPIRSVANIYLWLFRGTPTLLQLLFVWNALPQFLPALRSEWFSPVLAALVALTFNEAAYQAEITRAALSAVDDYQRAAARALGMLPRQVFTHIVLPQALRVAIPPTVNEYVNLLKVTSLASVISLRELLTVTSQTVAVNFRFAELYAAAAVYYLAMTSVLMIIQHGVEARVSWVRRRVRRARPGVDIEFETAGAFESASETPEHR